MGFGWGRRVYLCQCQGQISASSMIIDKNLNFIFNYLVVSVVTIREQLFFYVGVLLANILNCARFENARCRFVASIKNIVHYCATICFFFRGQVNVFGRRAR